MAQESNRYSLPADCCEAEMYAEPGATSVTCSQCSTEWVWDFGGWRRVDSLPADAQSQR